MMFVRSPDFSTVRLTVMPVPEAGNAPCRAAQLVNQLYGGIAAVLRRHPGVRRAPCDVDMNTGRTLAPYRQRIRRIAGLHVELHIVLAGQALDQFGRTR